MAWEDLAPLSRLYQSKLRHATAELMSMDAATFVKTLHDYNFIDQDLIQICRRRWHLRHELEVLTELAYFNKEGYWDDPKAVPYLKEVPHREIGVTLQYIIRNTESKDLVKRCQDIYTWWDTHVEWIYPYNRDDVLIEFGKLLTDIRKEGYGLCDGYYVTGHESEHLIAKRLALLLTKMTKDVSGIVQRFFKVPFEEIGMILQFIIRTTNSEPLVQRCRYVFSKFLNSIGFWDSIWYTDSI